MWAPRVKTAVPASVKQAAMYVLVLQILQAFTVKMHTVSKQTQARVSFQYKEHLYWDPIIKCCVPVSYNTFKTDMWSFQWLSARLQYPIVNELSHRFYFFMEIHDYIIFNFVFEKHRQCYLMGFNEILWWDFYWDISTPTNDICIYFRAVVIHLNIDDWI